MLMKKHRICTLSKQEKDFRIVIGLNGPPRENIVFHSAGEIVSHRYRSTFSSADRQ